MTDIGSPSASGNRYPNFFSRAGLSARFRARRSERLLNLLDAVSKGKAETRILDVGGVHGYWERLGLNFLRERNISVTMLNVSEPSYFTGELSGVRFASITGDARDMSMIEDGQFDLAHSNSVVEHVGLWNDMKRFANEIRRVAPRHYVQTPYYWFPIDPHYFGLPMFHWLPRPVRARALNTFPLATSGRLPNLDVAFGAVDNARLLDRWQMGHLFPDSKIEFERFAGLPKSMIAVR
jgi:hypothetical protein